MKGDSDALLRGYYGLARRKFPCNPEESTISLTRLMSNSNSLSILIAFETSFNGGKGRQLERGN